MFDADIKKRLAKLVSQPVLWECSMASYTSLGIGGKASAIVSVENESEIQNVLGFCKRDKLQYRVIGKGSNLLVNDDGFKGVVILPRGTLEKIKLLDNSQGKRQLFAGAGSSLTAVNKFCIRNALSGLEFSYGIPGTVGGAVVMNAGAWGGELADIIDSVSLVTYKDSITIKRNDLNFEYRTWLDYSSKFNDSVVTGVVLSCDTKSKEVVEGNCRKVLEKRKAAQPVKLPNAGSFFKNPADKTAGYLIDQCGLKGYRVGNVMVAKEHGNFFVNLGGGTAEDVRNLMEYVQEKVFAQYRITLKPEVHFI